MLNSEMKSKTYNPTHNLNAQNVNEGSRALPILYESRENCCGCSACYAVCPVHAISMEMDEEGFLYPAVNGDNCIRCYRCISVCSFKVDQEARGYLMRGGMCNASS